MKILYLEDNAQDADLVGRALTKIDPATRLTVAPKLARARRLLKEDPAWDLALLDVGLPDGTGLELLTEIRHEGLPIAVVFLTGTGDEDTAVAAMRAGADDYLVKRPGFLDRLPAVLTAALNRYREDSVWQRRPVRVLYGEHNEADFDLTRRHLTRHAPNLHLEGAKDSEAVLARLPKDPTEAPRFDVLLLDYRLRDLDALELLREIREVRRLDIPVVVVTGSGDESVAVQALRLGAGNYVVKHAGYLTALPGLLELAHHQAEAARHAAAQLANERWLRFALEAVKMGIWEWEPESDRFVISPEQEMLLGFPPGQFPGHWTAFTEVLHPEDREATVAAMRKAFAERSLFTHEFRVVWPDGSEHWMAGRGRVVTGREDRPANLAGTMLDITEQHRLQEEKLQMEAHLRQQQKLESIGVLASGVAHEINNPVNGIMNYAELIHDDPESGQGPRELANEIVHECKRIARVVQNLLTFARQEPDAPIPSRMHDVVEDTLSLMRTVTRRDQIQLEVSVPPDLPMVLARSGQLQQVLMNLLSNARDALNAKFAPGYDPNKVLKITGEAFVEDGARWVRVTVEDRGIGMSPHVQRRLFDPFFTTKSRFKGTGLGLGISLGIVEEHHGRLRVESREGEGSRFHLELPAWTESGQQPAEAEDNLRNSA